MDFDLRRFEMFVNGPCEEGFYDLAIPVSRAAIAEIADGQGMDGHFVFMAKPPAFLHLLEPRALFLIVDNTRLPTVRAANKMFRQFNRFAAKKGCLPVPVTLDYERRRTLYDEQFLRVRATDGDTPYPWNYMESLLLLYADDPDEAAQLFQEITT